MFALFLARNWYQLTVIGKNEYVLGASMHEEADLPYRYPIQTLWAIDKSICTLEPGKLVV